MTSENSLLSHTIIKSNMIIINTAKSEKYFVNIGSNDRKNLNHNLDIHHDNHTMTSKSGNKVSKVLSKSNTVTQQGVCYKHRYRKEPRKIPPELFKKQLQDTSDITKPCILLPHTKKLMQISEYDVDKFMNIPHNSTNKVHQQLFRRNCVTRREANEIDPSELNLLPLGYKRVVDPNTIKRITRKRKKPITIADDNTGYHSGTEENVEYVITNESVETTDYGALGHDGEVESYVFIDSDFGCTQEIISNQEEETVLMESGADSNSYTHSKSNNMDVLLAAASNVQHLVMLCHNISSSEFPVERLESDTTSRGFSA